MAHVGSRNVVNKQVFKASCILFSRIILKRLKDDSKRFFRKLENVLYKYEKLNADLSFLIKRELM